MTQAAVMDGGPVTGAPATTKDKSGFWQAGHKPTLDEALARLELLRTNGDSDQAFGWKYLKDAHLWRTHGCTQVAAE